MIRPALHPSSHMLFELMQESGARWPANQQKQFFPAFEIRRTPRCTEKQKTFFSMLMYWMTLAFSDWFGGRGSLRISRREYLCSAVRLIKESGPYTCLSYSSIISTSKYCIQMEVWASTKMTSMTLWYWRRFFTLQKQQKNYISI